ncbi:MAG TPA: hypothetical protein VG226_12595 [Acidimicrobiales bacterium]|nr:hypothetical protein [Acidimicrobiales bacterium]
MTLRRLGAWVLVVVASLAIPLAVASYWAVTTVTDANRYEATLSPLAQQPAITNAVADRATDRLFALAPGAAGALSSSQLHSTIRDRITGLLHTQAFQSTWDTAVRNSHPTAVAVLTGSASTGATTPVELNLTPVLNQAVTALHSQGIAAFDGPLSSVQGKSAFTVTVLSPKQVDESRQVFHVIVQLRWVLLAAAIVGVLGALALADRRRRVLAGLAVGTALVTVACLGGLAAARSVAVDRAQASNVNTGISTAVFDVLVRFLRVDLYITLGVAVGVAGIVAIWSLLRPRPAGRWR